MNKDCDELEEELSEHKENMLNLFGEAEELHRKALRIPFSKRDEATNKADIKQKEAIAEIHITNEIKNKMNEKHCNEETEDSLLDMHNMGIQEDTD